MRFYLVFTIIWIKLGLFSQDTICLNSNLYFSGRVLEINDDDVTFQVIDVSKNVFYILDKREISFIKYNSGEKDVFDIKNKIYHVNVPIRLGVNQKLFYKNQYTVEWPLKNFVSKKNTIYYEKIYSKNIVNYRLLKKFVALEPDSVKKKQIISSMSMLTKRKLLHQSVKYFGIGVTGVGIGMLFGAWMTNSINGDKSLFVPAATLLSAGIATDFIAYSIKLKRYRQTERLVTVLNGN